MGTGKPSVSPTCTCLGYEIFHAQRTRSKTYRNFKYQGYCHAYISAQPACLGAFALLRVRDRTSALGSEVLSSTRHLLSRAVLTPLSTRALADIYSAGTSRRPPILHLIFVDCPKPKLTPPEPQKRNIPASISAKIWLSCRGPTPVLNNNN